VDQVDELVRDHLEPEAAQRLTGAITQAKNRLVLLLSDANHDGTFGLLLLTEDGIEFLAPDGQVIVAARDDIVLADPRHRGSVAVTFTDGQELTFTDLGDSTWTREFAQAVNDFTNQGATARLTTEGRLVPTPAKSPQDTRYQGALFVALGLKIFAVLAVFGGVILAIAGAGAVSDTGGSVTGFVASSIAGTALTGLVLAFFGYALELLIDIWENTRISRAIAEEL
jgi:hypothetical protein